MRQKRQKIVATNQHTPRIKICGITRCVDADAALDLGVDAIGLVFYAASPRAITIAQAKEIAQVAGPFMTVTGLFVNSSVAEVNSVLQQIPLQLLQFHGDESAAFCKQFQRPWMKALRMKPDMNILQGFRNYQEANAILLDSYKPGVNGGTGEVFDWSLVSAEKLPHEFHMPVILAGGLTADNVVAAIRQVHPYAVDVSGGVESGPGKKDANKMKTFVDAVRNSQ